MKQEASGWPEWCQSENDKWRYIRDYHEKKGIFMDYNNIKKNPSPMLSSIRPSPMFPSMIFLRRYVDTVSVAGFHYMFYTE
jgi:hypothetical protein